MWNASVCERFLYWMKERHNIYLRRRAGQPKPWTDDPTLQQVYFTNPYRENDKVTTWFRENIRDPFNRSPRALGDIVFATVAFRWFNTIETGERLVKSGLLDSWDARLALDILRGTHPFTGAFIINSPPGEGKLWFVCRSLTKVATFARLGAHNKPTMRECWESLQAYRSIGAFMAYEFVCDLRYTRVGESWPDVDTWANVGPGAKRGLNRLVGRATSDLNKQTTFPAMEGMISLLHWARERFGDSMPHLELREIEHSLCEFDKYERFRTGEGGSVKRTYDGR
jgi:hypothetical protein